MQMLDRTLQPPIRDFNIPQLIQPKPFRFANGVVLRVFNRPSLDLIHLTIKIKAGALYEPKKRVSSFCYNLLKESHKDMTPSEIDDFIDYFGTSFSITAGVNHILLNIVVPKSNCDKIIPFLTELLIEPAFKVENLERYRAKTIKDFNYNREKTSYWSTQLMFHVFFKDALPFGKLIEQNDLEIITLEDIQAYYTDTCCAENIQLFVAGNIDTSLLDLLEKHFSKIRSHRAIQTVTDDGIRFQPNQVAVHWENAQQTTLTLCRPLFGFNHKDAFPFKFTNTLFGNYFGSRLMQNLREKNGYTYGISSGIFYYENASIYYIESDVNNDKVSEAVDAVFQEMQLLRTEIVAPEEMELVRNYLLGSILRNLDGTISYMESYITPSNYGHDESYFAQQIDCIKHMTAEDVSEMANKYLQPEEFSTITVGGNDSFSINN